MNALYNITGQQPAYPLNGTVRTYYIQAVSVLCTHGRALDSVYTVTRGTHDRPSKVTTPGSDSAHLERPFSARFTLSSTPWCTQEEHLWDYAPDNGESCSGSVEPFGSSALTYVTANSTRIGRTYIKALYVEYTDENFTTVKVHGTLQARALCHSC